MTYEQALEYIHGISRFVLKPGLERIEKLLDRMGNPQKQLRFIHVAGTNGKGSTCTMLSCIMQDAGLRTGLFISPYVLDFRERIQLNGTMIEKDALADITAEVKAHCDALAAQGTEPSEFEVVTAIAMRYYEQMRADIVVLEVGLGGRLDSTNVIDTPLCSVITSISSDHTEYLGKRIESITAEKCGIIKHGGITVSYPRQPPEALAVIMERCAAMENRLLMPINPANIAMSRTGSQFAYDGLEIHVGLCGEHQVYNAATAIEAVKAVRLSNIAVSDAAIRSGIARARIPSRFELIATSPVILLDGAHNLSGADSLREALSLYSDCRIHAVCAMMSDKDVRGCLEKVLLLCASVTIAPLPDVPRALPPDALQQIARDYCPDTHVAADCRDALAIALSRCEGEDAVLIFGSFFLASEIRPIVLENIQSGKIM